ncbi:MAG: dynamin family protein, partial [Limnospira sp.]
MVNLILGTMCIDGSVDENEKRQAQAIIKRFVSVEGDARRLIQLVFKGIQEKKLHKSWQPVLILGKTFSESEKLLLISFGYQISAADGEIQPVERKYLEAIGNHLGLQAQHLAILEAGLTHQPVTNTKALAEVRYLLDPARFQKLDPVFVDAASYIEESLPVIEEERSTSSLSINLSHTTLAEFQECKSKISVLCSDRLLKILQDLQQRNVVPDQLIETFRAIFEQFDSQSFRVAVIGEFSKGKSTLLNTLLGAKVQPTRAIPCSGTVSILRYGEQKRVICQYKNGERKEIPFDEYHEKVSISKEAARGNLESELSQVQIQEVIFETPDLEFCKNGVEIVDSPGLNEHPERTAITIQVLQDTDAVVFLTSAQNVLTESERGLLDQIRHYGREGNSEQPQNNIFVVVNCIDLLDEEDDREDTRERVEAILSASITGDRRIHYLSAKQALNGILNNQDNEYVRDFKAFTDALEHFLTVERGSIKLSRFSRITRNFIENIFAEIDRYYQPLKSQIDSSSESKNEVSELVEQIGEISGRNLKINQLSERILKTTIDSAQKSFSKTWRVGLEERLENRKKEWKSEHNFVLSRDKLVKDYIEQLNQDIYDDLNQWIHSKLDGILKLSIGTFDSAINKEVEAIKANLRQFDISPDNNQNNWIFNPDLNMEIEDQDRGEFGWSLGMVGLGIAVLIPGILFGPLLTTILGVVAFGGLAGGGVGGMMNIDGKIRDKVFEEGIKLFDNSQDRVIEKINNSIKEVFDRKLESFDKIVKNTISVYENQIEQSDQIVNETPKQLKAEIEWLDRQQESLK